MTRQDYELIADVVRETCPMSGRAKVTMEFARRLNEQNPRFNPVLFTMRACNMNDRMATRTVVGHGIAVNDLDLLQAEDATDDPVGTSRR